MKEKLLKSKLKKHPQWINLFEDYLKEDSTINLEKIEKCFEKIVKNRQIFKDLINDAYSFLELKDNRSILERLEDKIDSKIHEHKKQKFIKSLKTEKYKHLFNKNVEKEIEIIIDNGININVLKYQFFNKLAGHKSAIELLTSLQDFKEKNIAWNKEFYLSKIKNESLNVEIIEETENSLMIQVNDYNACQTLGSQAWCIVKSKIYFEEYTKHLSRQIIYYDFNKNIDDHTSMIGLTIGMNGEIKDSYLKSDDPTPKIIKDKFYFQSLDKDTIKKYLKNLNSNQTAFYVICKNGLIDFFDEYIHKEDVNPSFDSNYAIQDASENGHLDVINHLLKDKRVDPSANNNYAIRWASLMGHLDVVNRLLEDQRVDPSVDQNFAIRRASGNGEINIVTRLLEDPRVDPSDYDNSAIQYASVNGHIDVVNILLRYQKVCQKLDKDWIKKRLNKDQMNIYRKTLMNK